MFSMTMKTFQRNVSKYFVTSVALTKEHLVTVWNFDALIENLVRNKSSSQRLCRILQQEYLFQTNFNKKRSRVRCERAQSWI